MATRTLGTNATTTLVAVNFAASLLDADVATIQQNILNDLNTTLTWPGAFAKNGLLYVPNRGVLKVLVGDYVAYDPNGWPILVAANSIAGSGWTHT